MTAQTTQSQELGALAAALCKAQSVMEGAKQDSSNPFFKSKYADLASVWAACKVPLTSNGLSVVQTVENGGEKAYLVTILLHTSGQWIKSLMPIIMTKNDAQALGSAITYCRRYALAAIVGVCPTDDDGNAAVSKESLPKQTISKMQIEEIERLLGTRSDIRERLLDWAEIDQIKDLPIEDYSAAIVNIKNALKPGASV
jgi:hypothetical protein